LAFAPAQRTPNRLRRIVFQNQIWAIAAAAKPVVDLVLRLGDCGADRTLGGSSIGIGRSARYMRLPLHSLSEFVIGPSNVLTQNVAAGSFVDAQVTGRTAGSHSF